jgi:hypothetical protein
LPKIETALLFTSLSLELSSIRDVSFCPLGTELTFPKVITARKAFTPPEDLLLSRLVAVHGDDKWDLVARFMNNRNARQCRERWRTVLGPGLVNGPWCHSEDMLLTKLYQEHGPKWSFIAKHFQGRSDSNVKNRWVRHLMMMKREPDLEPAGDEVRDPWVSSLDELVDNGSLFQDCFINW